MQVSDSSQSTYKTLSEICFYDEKLHGDEFVGIKYENGKLSIHFPLGYRPSSTEQEIRKDILNLISVLSSFADKDSFIHESAGHNKFKQFPIHAYIFVISNYFSKGYFTQKETIYKPSTSGKINWNRTIKHIQPEVSADSAFYLDFIRKHISHNENELITEIHKYCVYESFSKIGYLFTSFIPAKPTLAFNYKLFRAVVQTQIAQTFNENDLLLFHNLMQIIEYLDSEDSSKYFYYGTYHFEHIWERIIDTIYGIPDKEKFYPKCKWVLYDSDGTENELTYKNDIFKKYSLRPDTIMITDRGKEGQKVFVLDSKYYKYGVSNGSYDLPGTDSIIKQIAYAEFIDNKSDSIPSDVLNALNGDNIYNAFILPYNHNDGPVLRKFGYSTSEHKGIPDKPYNKIYGILLDVKTVMYKHISSNDAIKQLAEIIEK